MSLQLMSEERVGRLVRMSAYRARAEEDAAFDALASGLGVTP